MLTLLLKHANITPVFKKGFRGSNKTIALLVFYKLFQKSCKKIINKQLTTFMGPLLSKYQCRFRKDFKAPNFQRAMLEKWKLFIDKGKVFGVLLADFSKAFNCLFHELIIVKLNSYGFSLTALKLMYNYLVEQKQRIRSIKLTTHGKKYYLRLRGR